MLLIWLKFEWCRKKLWKNIIKLKCCLYFRPYSHCVIIWSLWLCIFVTCQGKTLIALTLYDKLRNFKYIYILYFLVDLLHDLTILSKIFQYKFVDAANIRSFVKKQIKSTYMLYGVDNTDLNQYILDKVFEYHVIQTMALKVDIFKDCPLILEVQSSTN